MGPITVNGNDQSSSSSGLSWLTSKLGEGLNQFKSFAQWLITVSNPNYIDHSDKAEASIDLNALAKEMGLKSGDGLVEDDSHLGLVEKLFKSGRKVFSQTNIIRLLYESVGGLGSCLVGSGYTDRDLGEVSLNASLYCDIRCCR